MPERLDDLGDPSAPVGSTGWVKAQHFHLCAAKRDVQSRVDNFGGSLMLMREKRWYGELADRGGATFSSFEDYCQYPEPWGLGLAPADVRRILEEPDGAKPVVAVLGARPGPRGGEKNSSHARRIKEGTDTKEYKLTRLDRDRPDLAARVRAGELSANAAAIAAGFRKPRKALNDLCAAWRRATPEERDRFEDWVAEFRRRAA